jgi:hypothetical protein
MKISVMLALAAAGVMVWGCASGESYFRAGYDFSKVDKVAVIDVVGEVRGNAAKNQISDFFVMELLQKGYAPVERAQVQTLLKEQDFQASDITSTEDAARAGRILNVPVVMIVNIPEFGEKMSMTAKMVNVEDGSILWLGSGTGKTQRLLGTVAGAAAGAAAGAVVAGGDSQTEGAVIGGVLGGVTAHELSPMKAEQARKVTKQICKSLPSRVKQ